jgi:predicted transglutaminase-like protease
LASLCDGRVPILNPNQIVKIHYQHTRKPIGTAEDILKEIEKKLNNDKTFTKSHIVLLSHDEMFRYQYEESVLKKLIDLLKSKDGYKISQLKDYP